MRLYTGNISQGTTIGVREFDIKITKILDNYINFDIERHDEAYTKGMAGTNRPAEDFISKTKDIRITYWGKVGNSSNISVYTPQRARIRGNITAIPDSDYSTIIGSPHPSVRANETFEAEFFVENSGELPSMQMEVSQLFKDFQVIKSQYTVIPELCPNSSTRFRYQVKAPGIWVIHNYTLLSEVKYVDIAPISLNQRSYADLINGTVTVVGESDIMLEKKIIYPWDSEKSRIKTPAEEGDRIIVINNITNKGKVFDFHGKIIDSLPDGLILLSGPTTWEGKISPGQSRFMTYAVTSRTPLSYTTFSTIEFQDPLGIVKTKKESEKKVIEFSGKRPEIEIERKVEKTKVDLTEFGKINLDTNESTKVTVILENKGAEPAYNVSARESSEFNMEGTTTFKGTILPGEKISYSYTIRGSKQGKNPLHTIVNYKDKNHNSYQESLTTYVYVNAPVISISMSFTKEEEKVEIGVTLSNKGNKKARDIIVTSQFPGDLRLIKYDTMRLEELAAGSSTSFTYVVLLREKILSEDLFFNTTAVYKDESRIEYREELRKSLTGSLIKESLPITITGTSHLDIGQLTAIKVNIRNDYQEDILISQNVDIPPGLAYLPEYGEKDRTFNLKKGEIFQYQFTIKASEPGAYKLKLSTVLGTRSLINEYPIKVKGPNLEATSRLSAILINLGEEMVLQFQLKNIGEAIARNITIVQETPVGLETREINMSYDELAPGKEITLSTTYTGITSTSSRFQDYILFFQDENSGTYNKTGPGTAFAVIEEEIIEGPEPDKEIKGPGDRSEDIIKAGIGFLIYLIIIYLIYIKIFKGRWKK